MKYVQSTRDILQLLTVRLWPQQSFMCGQRDRFNSLVFRAYVVTRRCIIDPSIMTARSHTPKRCKYIVWGHTMMGCRRGRHHCGAVFADVLQVPSHFRSEYVLFFLAIYLPFPSGCFLLRCSCSSSSLHTTTAKSLPLDIVFKSMGHVHYLSFRSCPV